MIYMIENCPNWTNKFRDKRGIYEIANEQQYERLNLFILGSKKIKNLYSSYSKMNHIDRKKLYLN